MIGGRLKLVILVALALIGLAGVHASGRYLFSHPAKSPFPTIRNFDGLGIGQFNRIVLSDVNGNRVRNDNGTSIVQFPSDPLFYLYGVDNFTPALFSINNAPVPITVYTSPDLKNWTPAGGFDGLHVTDPSSSAWQTVCNTGPFTTTHSVCWLPHMIFSPVLGHYVLWFNNVNNNYSVQCTTKVGGCANPGSASNCQVSGKESQNGNPFIDPDTGLGYMVYAVTDTSPTTFDTYVQALTADYTDCTGSPVAVCLACGEEASMFKKASTFYIMLGPNCAFCTGTPSRYYSTTTPLTAASWSGPTSVDLSNSCGGQPNRVEMLTFNSVTNYLYTIALWDYPQSSNGEASQTQSTIMMTPLTFTGTAVNTITCPDTVILTGLTDASTNALTSGTDQSTEYLPPTVVCDINSATQRAQTFTAGKTGSLTQVRVRTGLGDTSCLLGNCSGHSTGPNQPLTVAIKNTTAGVPSGADLTSFSLATGGVPGWGLFEHTFSAGSPITVTAGTQYALIMRSTASVGCWTFAFSGISDYTGGNALFSSNGGSTWTSQPGTALLFSTVVP